MRKLGNEHHCKLIYFPYRFDIFFLQNGQLHASRGGSRGRQTSHATNVKIANLIKVLNIRPIVQLFFIMQRHLIIVQYLLSCSGSN